MSCYDSGYYGWLREQEEKGTRAIGIDEEVIGTAMNSAPKFGVISMRFGNAPVVPENDSVRDPLQKVREKAASMLADGIDPRAVLGELDTCVQFHSSRYTPLSVDQFAEKVAKTAALNAWTSATAASSALIPALTDRCYHGRCPLSCPVCIEVQKRSDSFVPSCHTENAWESPGDES